MSIIFFFRAILWLKELVTTLIKFWIKNPQETLSIIRFLSKKIYYLPKFLSRNVEIEKHSQSFEDSLNMTADLYDKLPKKFDLFNEKNLKKISGKLSEKEQLLYFLIRRHKPKIIVETGVAAGRSTGYILKAIIDNNSGKLYSIDLPFQWYVYGKNHELHLDSLPTGKLPGYLVPSNLKRNWKLILGDTYQELPKLLNKLSRIDTFLHDSEHSYKAMTFEYQEAWPHLEKDGLLLSDDVDFTKAFNDFNKAKKNKFFIFKKLGLAKKNG